MKINKWLILIFILFLIASFRNNNVVTTKPKWTTGIALYSFHHHPFVKAIAMADSAGVSSVEGFSFYKLGAPFHDHTLGSLDNAGIALMKQLLAKKKIRMISMYVGDARNATEWKKYFDLGKAFGMKYLVCEPDKSQWDMIDSMAGLYNIKIAIHEHVKGSSAYWHPDSVLAAIKGHKNIGACADLGHWARSGLNVVDCLRKLEGHILGLHVKDIDESGNPNAKDVLPGTGIIDFRAVVAELKRQQFNGYAQVECEHNMDHNLPDVIESIRYFNGLSVAKK